MTKEGVNTILVRAVDGAGNESVRRENVVIEIFETGCGPRGPAPKERTPLGPRSLFSLFSSDLAIDLGTANTLVFAEGRGIVVREPSIVAVNRVTNKVEAVGSQAKEMLGRTPGNIVAIRPMKDGVIADFEITEKMLDYFIKKANGRSPFLRPKIVISVPSRTSRRSRSARLRTRRCRPAPARSSSSSRPWPPRSARGSRSPSRPVT